MLKNKSLFHLAFLIIFSLSSCGEITEPLSSASILDDQFEVSLWQKLTPNGSVPQLRIDALQPQDCLDSEIDITHTQGQYLINDYNIPSPCNNPGVHYPIFYDDIDASKQFSLDVFGEGTSEGEIKVGDEIVQLDFESQNLILLNRPELQLIQKNIYWGFFEIDDEEISDIAENRLTQTIEQAFNIADGDYGYFIWSDNMVSLNESTSSYARSFLHESNETSWPNVALSLQSIKDQYPAFKAKFTNWDGEVIEF